jgi:hypothetical protein
MNQKDFKRLHRIIISIIMLWATTDLNSCNLCWGFSGVRKLRPDPIEKLDNCSCECWKYPHTKGDNNYYVCTVCQHRLTPEEILLSKGQKKSRHQFKRWNDKSKDKSGL